MNLKTIHHVYYYISFCSSQKNCFSTQNNPYKFFLKTFYLQTNCNKLEIIKPTQFIKTTLLENYGIQCKAYMINLVND